MPSWSPVRPCRRGTLWGACCLCRLPILPLACFLAPIPPTPFPGGEGGDYKFILPGAPPPAPRHQTAYGTDRHCHYGTRRGACRLCRLPILPLTYFLAPIPPPPFPAGRGETISFFAGGSAPGTPAFKRLRYLQNLPSRYPAGACPRRRQFGAKPSEPPFYWQCRQPRRGGTGGEELRRLRWSSPPGQG